MGGPQPIHPMGKGENMKSNGNDVHTDTPSHPIETTQISEIYVLRCPMAIM